MSTPEGATRHPDCLLCRGSGEVRTWETRNEHDPQLVEYEPCWCVHWDEDVTRAALKAERDEP